ncbi:hypothetical protein [Natronohydrobacter thiooxidans]|uniref:hypothetical protein n=1 Tax=Natronohydrobacter thiooxidans TaxID=87172 RepID=UPI0008FF6C2C|nr:hypothetical protein [Natronohydrobacter thiooxidans]
MTQDAAELPEKHRKLASNMRKLKARHEAALREIAFLRARLAMVEPHAPQPAILSGFPARYHLPAAPRTPVTHWKEARERLLWSGLAREQALHLEVTCLIRLAQGQGAAQFPRLLALEMPAGRFELTDQGQTLLALRTAGRQIRVPDAEMQIATILAALEAARVVHLDLHRDGRNLCLDAGGRLSLIDFDIAALDGVPFSGEIAARLAEFHAAGGYAGFGTRMRAIIAALRDQR